MSVSAILLVQSFTTPRPGRQSVRWRGRRFNYNLHKWSIV